MTYRILSRLFALAMALALAVPAYAQTGLVKGKVVGPDGKPVADAVITIEYMEGGNRKLTTKSDKRGEFVQLGLQSGAYRITATTEKLGVGHGRHAHPRRQHLRGARSRSRPCRPGPIRSWRN